MVIQMNAVFGAIIVVAALCLPAHARDQPLPPLTTDDLVAVCWYDMLEELCEFPVTAKQRAALSSVRRKIKADSVDGEELTANVMCSSFQADAKRHPEHVCTPATKKQFIESLDGIVRGEESAAR